MNPLTFDDEVPLFVRDTIEFFVTYRLHPTGDWDLDLPHLAADADEAIATAPFVAVLHCTLTAFSFAAPAQIRWGGLTAAGDVVKDDWTPERGPVAAWLATLPARAERSRGATMPLDMRLAWRAPDGACGEARLPRVAEVWFSVDPLNRFLSAALDIYPNLFSDVIEVGERDRQAPWPAWEWQEQPFQPAARLNRARLRRAMQTWERRCRGRISTWQSDQLTGVERYGFAEDARLDYV